MHDLQSCECVYSCECQPPRAVTAKWCTHSILAPARLAFIADVVGRDTMTNAIFLSISTVQVARVLSPAVANRDNVSGCHS